MKILCIDPQSNCLDWLMRCRNYGHQVKWFDRVRKDGTRRTAGDGIIDKIDDIDGFHRDFITGFKQTEWWDKHRKENRHHLMEADGVPEDVNLIDVLDMIADCVMAGMARSGSVYPLNIPNDVLVKAFQNTVELLKAHVDVVE